MPSIKPALIAACLTAALPNLAQAATPTPAHHTTSPQQWQLDLAHTRIGFAVKHMGFSTTMGRFKQASGTVNYNIKHPNATTMSFAVNTDSIDTGWPARDEHLKSKEFFNAAKYSTMRFQSTNVHFINPVQAKVTGQLTLLGQTRPLTLDVTLNRLADSPLTHKPVIGFRATGRVDRSQYGMDAYAKLITTDVPIQIDGELNPTKPQ